MIVDRTSLDKHLRAIADEALVHYDSGDRLKAFACFLKEMARQPETAGIIGDYHRLENVRSGCHKSRADFEKAILGCAG